MLKKKHRKYFTIEEITKPKDRYEVILNHFWALTKDNHVIIFREEPQCNVNEEVTKRLSKILYSGNYIFLPVAYVPPRKYI